MAKGKNVLTTGDVARICNVAPRTVSKWFDTGQLKGYRIPGSKDRRIPINELKRFMKENNMPLTALPVGQVRVLLISNSQKCKKLAEKIQENVDYEVIPSSDEFHSGILVQKYSPHVLILDLNGTRIDHQMIINALNAYDDLQTIKLVAIDQEANEKKMETLLQQGFATVIDNPENVKQVVKRIEEATAIIY